VKFSLINEIRKLRRTIYMSSLRCVARVVFLDDDELHLTGREILLAFVAYALQYLKPIFEACPGIMAANPKAAELFIFDQKLADAVLRLLDHSHTRYYLADAKTAPEMDEKTVEALMEKGKEYVENHAGTGMSNLEDEMNGSGHESTVPDPSMN